MASKRKREFDYFQTMAKLIAKNGRAVQSVPATQLQRGFAYTVGNQEKGYPELLILGAWGETAGAILDALSRLMLARKKAFTDGELVELPEYSIKFTVYNALDPRAKTDYCRQAGNFYDNQDYKVQQVVIPDPEGRLPGDPECDENYKVPLLRNSILMP